MTTRLKALVVRDLTEGLYNRFLQAFAVACVLGGIVLMVMNPGPEALPYLLLQAMLYFGSLFGLLVGWSVAGQTVEEGSFLFAQPVGETELLIGKLLGSALLSVLVLSLFMLPPAIALGFSPAFVQIFGFSIMFVLVFLAIGLVIGFSVKERASGLMVMLLAWMILLVGWDLGLMALAATDLVQGMNWIWALILLLNPVDAFRISILFGLEAIPMAPGGELESLGFLFDRIGFTALGSFVLWIFLMIVIGGWRLRRQEHRLRATYNRSSFSKYLFPCLPLLLTFWFPPCSKF